MEKLGVVTEEDDTKTASKKGDQDVNVPWDEKNGTEPYEKRRPGDKKPSKQKEGGNPFQ